LVVISGAAVHRSEASQFALTSFNRLFVHSVGFQQRHADPPAFLTNMLTLVARASSLAVRATRDGKRLTVCFRQGCGGGGGGGRRHDRARPWLSRQVKMPQPLWPEIELDASGSTGTGTLSYKWRSA
jgi:hypothetical protein